MVKAVYLAGNSYPHDRHLEERVIELLASRLGIDTIPQSQLIPYEPPFSLYPLDPAVREQTLSALIEGLDEPVILLGRSSGTRTITKFAENNPDKVVACICFAYPFQAVGQPPEDWRTKHLQTLATPTLIIQGRQDRYGSSELTTRFDLNPHTDVLYVDADHESDYHSQDWTRIGTEIEKLILKTIEKLAEKRCVFFISGFDPRGAKHYYSLLFTEIEKKNAEAVQCHDTDEASGSVSGCIKVSESKPIHPFTTAWHTACTSTQVPVNTSFTTHTEFQFLGWDDIVRAHWSASRLKHWLHYLQVNGRVVLDSVCPRIWNIAKPAPIYLCTPNLVIFMSLLALFLLACIALWSMHSIGSLGWPAAVIAATSVLAGWAVWQLAHAFEISRHFDWMMRRDVFTAKQAHGEIPELEPRIDAFARQIVERAQQNIDDEILVVGHSSGASLAISALARAISQYPTLLHHKAKVALLTLGQYAPAQSLLPKVNRFRQELAVLAQQPDLLWVDLSSNLDQLSTPTTERVTNCAIAVHPHGKGMTVCQISSPFYLVRGANSQRRNHSKVFDLHFQYLKHVETQTRLPAFSVAHDNYLNISTSALRLHQRFKRHIPIPLPEGFEASVYLRLNPDVALAAMSAEDHYRFHGKRERRAYLIALPKDFEAQTYLALNPDVAQAGVAADLHYAMYGVKENRRYRYA